MAHQRESIHASAGQFQSTSSAAPPLPPPHTYDFLQVPQNQNHMAHINPIHDVVGDAHLQGHPVNFMELQRWHLQRFWQQQVLQLLENLEDYKQHQLPLARIKRIMKLDGEAKMVSANTPIFFAKACELFILELTVRSWLHAEQCKRHTVRRTDVAGAICHAQFLHFLIDILHPEELQVYMRQPQILQQHMVPQQQPCPNHMLSEPPPPL